MGQNSASRLSSQQVSRAIDALDLGPIKFKLMDKEEGKGWSRTKAERVEILYRRFLLLVARYPDRTIVPTREIDDFWHAHILDTKKYAEDTERVFGFFLHHFPYFGMRGEADRNAMECAFAATLECYDLEFGGIGPPYNDAMRVGGAICGRCSGGSCGGGNRVGIAHTEGGRSRLAPDFSIRPSV